MVEDDINTLGFEMYAERQRPCVPYTKADTMPCYTPCEEYAMEQAGILSPDTTNLMYVQTLEACMNPPQIFNTECEAKRMAMLADMSPGGQYFDNIRTCCPNITTYDCSSESNIFLNSICTRRFEDDTLLRYIKDSVFHLTAFNDALWDSMRLHWIPEYAEVMLKYHPEYHLYKAFCDCGNSEEQRRYDSVFMNTNNYDTAVALGLFNPLGMNKNLSTQIQSNWNSGYQPFDSIWVDPFFDTFFSCCSNSLDTFRRYMIKRLNGYLSWDNQYLSLWWLLENPLHIDSVTCPAQYLPIKEVILSMDSMITQLGESYGDSDDFKWLFFKSSYIYLKNEIRQNILPACFLRCSLTHDSNEVDCCYEIPFRWGQAGWWSDYFNTTSCTACDLYLAADDHCHTIPLTQGNCERDQGGFQIRFLCNPIYGMTTDNLQDTSNTSLEFLFNDCNNECEAYANSWMEELHDYFKHYCSDIFSDTAKLNAIRKQLVDWCKESCDTSKALHDYSVLRQRINPDSLATLLGDSCYLDPNNYPRIVFPPSKDMYVDCACNNYLTILHSHGLTYWDDIVSISKELENEGISSDPSDINAWNHFCIWTRLDSLTRRIDDTATLYSYSFPEQFRCQPDLPDSALCRQQAILAAAAQDTISFYNALEELVASHKSAYLPHCMNNIQESLTIKSSSSEFLYTLYYYDQADNLIKTVPPEGVHVIDNQTTLDAVAAYRNNVARYDTLQSGFVRPNHTMVTNYRYNTLNQVIQSYQPDYDSVSYVYYDILSRPVLSQDGKQRQGRKYSYTVYDDLGRIVEVGQVKNSTSVTPSSFNNCTGSS